MPVPTPLRAAGALVAAQGLGLVLLAVVEAFVITSERATMGVTTALFFAAYGVVLGVAGWGLARSRSWSRAFVVLTQLIWLGVAWSFRGGGTTWVAALLAVSALVVLVCVFLPASTASLTRDS